MLEDKDLLSIQEVRTKVEKAYAAWQKYRTYSQEQVDAIVERMAAAARANAQAAGRPGRGRDRLRQRQGQVRQESALNCRLAAPPHARHEDRRHHCANCPKRRSSRSACRWAWWRRFCRPPIPLPPRFTRPSISLKAGNAIVISPHPARQALHLRNGRRAVPGGARSRRARRHHPVRRHARPSKAPTR